MSLPYQFFGSVVENPAILLNDSHAVFLTTVTCLGKSIDRNCLAVKSLSLYDDPCSLKGLLACKMLKRTGSLIM